MPCIHRRRSANVQIWPSNVFPQPSPAKPDGRISRLRLSGHSGSDHLRFSTWRVPLPPRWRDCLLRASPLRSQARQNRRPNRVPRSLCVETCCELVVHCPLLATRGYRPGAASFPYWPHSDGQVRDSHPAVRARAPAHDRTRPRAQRLGFSGRARTAADFTVKRGPQA